MTRRSNDAPKRAKSAYIAFVVDRRAAIAAGLGEDATFQEVGKAVGAKWRSTSPQRRKKYEEAARIDRKRYADEMAEYVPSTKKPKKTKDPNAPKRPLSSYLLFAAERRAAAINELPEGHAFGDVGRKLGEAWRALSHQHRAAYAASASRLREEYAAAAVAAEESL